MRIALANFIARDPAFALAFGGALIGFAFGSLARSTNYCVMGAISDWQLSSDLGRLGATAMAAAVAIIGAQSLDAFGVVDLSRSTYLGPGIHWLGAIIGGMTFGAGMVYAGGCPSRSLVRAGGGDMRAAVVLIVMAIAAYASISGVLGDARVFVEQTTAIDLRGFGFENQAIGTMFVSLGLTHAQASLLAVAVVTLPLLYFAIATARLIARPSLVMAGVGVGALVTAAWALTGLASDDMRAQPLAPQALSFVKPVADAIDWLQRSTALGFPSFGAASVFGVIAGAGAVAVVKRDGRWVGFTDGADFNRHISGALAMGIGGVVGLGCTIGQGASGVSTLALQSILTSAAIVVGAVLALRRLQATI